MTDEIICIDDMMAIYAATDRFGIRAGEHTLQALVDLPPFEQSQPLDRLLASSGQPAE